MLPVQKPLVFSLKNDSKASTLPGSIRGPSRLKKQPFRSDQQTIVRCILKFDTIYLWVFVMMAFSNLALGQNYDEQKVPAYKLPDPMRGEDDKLVESVEAWARRREQILRAFEGEVYGKGPAREMEPEYKVTEDWTPTLDGKAERKQIAIVFNRKGSTATIRVLLYRPAEHEQAVPVFVGLNFIGNASIHPDPAIRLHENWTIGSEEEGVIDHRVTAASRGKKKSRWPIAQIIDRGYAIATAHCGDIDPDFDDGFENGIHPLFADEYPSAHADDTWGTIGAWSWGLSRILDYLDREPTIDHRRSVVIGHSRLGKTALWAGAQDERFAIVISNNSGCGGAALSRRKFGETVQTINMNFPHWFCSNFKKYNQSEENLPLDQHMLVALIAPRPVYVASATEDLWADPKGEFLSLLHADPVYKLMGTAGLPIDRMPDPDQPVQGTMGYHLRSGPHDITLYDWMQYLDFTDQHFGVTKSH